MGHMNAQVQLVFWLATGFCIATYALWYRIKFVLRAHGYAPHWFGFGIQHMRQVHQVIKTSDNTTIKTHLRRLLTSFYASWLLFVLLGATFMWLVLHGYSR
jgi:hypothetical protein